MKNVLFEIGTEELPAGFLKPVLEQLKNNFIKKAGDLEISHDKVKVLGTPRRLALIVNNLSEKQSDRKEEFLGPSKKAGFNEDGEPTKAALGFARSKGCDVSELKVVDTEKGEYLMIVRELEGRPTMELLPELFRSLILELSFPKSMRWGMNRHTFGRPIQWLLAIYDDKTVDFELDGIHSSNRTWGHRFMANSEISIQSAEEYVQSLEKAHVIVDPEARREKVLSEITTAVKQYIDDSNACVAIDEGLVETVTNLVESPYGVCGSFEDRFLDLPDDVLITSMREHQKYFPVVEGQGGLLPAFVAVNNTQVNDTAITRTGHERVLRARLEDALFFFRADRKTKLESRCEELSGIIFQAKLGSMLEKSRRVIKLTTLLAEKLSPELTQEAARAAELCKADLLSDMVVEFPSLQGVMGAAYALHDGESDIVASAIMEHYMPKRAGAELPQGDAGALVGMADRLDTIAGCFGIGQVPSGTADPFGLRRLSLAILHIIEDRGYTLSLKEIIHKALALYGDKVDGSLETVDNVLGFIKGRFINDKISKGGDQEAIDAVTSIFFDDVNDCIQRIEAFKTIRNEDAFALLTSSFKRIRNITKDNRTTEIEQTLFEEESERELNSVYEQVSLDMEKMLAVKEYHQALKSMIRLKGPVDRFFDDVMVMVDEDRVRQNRLNLLTAIGELILKIGDISRMRGADSTQ